jgi:hypothetical protein
LTRLAGEVSDAFFDLLGVFPPCLGMLATRQLYQAVKDETFGKVLQRTLTRKARFERLLNLLCSAPVMMCSGMNGRHITCATSATSFESEWQGHYKYSFKNQSLDMAQN